MQSKSKQESAKETAMKVKIIYDRARIPTLDPKKMAQEVEKLHKEILNILKNSEERIRAPGAAHDAFVNFQENLDKTFKMWPRNVIDRITNENYKLFFQSMITDRKWSMGGKDQPLSKQEAQVLERKIEEKRREKCRKELKNMLSIPSSSIECDDNCEQREQEDPTHHDQNLDLTPKRKSSHKRTSRYSSRMIF